MVQALDRTCQKKQLKWHEQLFPKVTYLTLRDELETIYANHSLEGLFPKREQLAESPGLLAFVVVLQFAETLSDRLAGAAVRSRIKWKYLLGLELVDSCFDFLVLSDFRW